MRYMYKHMEELSEIEVTNYQDYSGNLILYGAGVNGALCAFELQERGIEFLCFCDGDTDKQGKDYLGYPVLSPEECREQYPEATVLFDVYCTGRDLEKFDLLGYKNIIFPVFLFIGLDCEKAACFITEKHRRGDKGYTFREQIDAFQVFEWIDEYMIRGVRYVTGRKDMSKCINLDITDFCTLRCKGCLALKPYFQEKRTMDWESMERIIDRLIALKWFRRFHILGGEPFTCPYLDKLLEKLCAVPEVEHISVITNGTVIPRENVLNALKNEKVLVRVSYYGDLSTKYRELERLCLDQGTAVRVHAQRWQDIGRPLTQGSNATETKKRFLECSQREGSYFYILHGKATLCPFAANTRELGLYKPGRKDYVDLEVDVSPETLRKQLHDLYWETTPLIACEYCNGWLPYSTKSIPVAEQYAANENPTLPCYD